MLPSLRMQNSKKRFQTCFPLVGYMGLYHYNGIFFDISSTDKYEPFDVLDLVDQRPILKEHILRKGKGDGMEL